MAIQEELLITNTVEDKASAPLDAGTAAAERFDAAMDGVVEAAASAGQSVSQLGSRILEAAPAYERLASRVDQVTRLQQQLSRAVDAHSALQEQATRELAAGTITQQDAERVLTSSAVAIERMSERLGAARADADALRSSQAALNGTLSTGLDAVRGFSEAIAAQAQAQANAKRAAQESAQALASIAAAAKEAAQAQADYNAQLGVKIDFSDAAASAAAFTNEMDRIRAKIDPVFAASKQYEAVLNEISEAQKVGAISAAQAAAAQDRATAAFQRAHGSLEDMSKSTGGANAAMRGLGIQAIQTFSGLATGQPVMMTLIQQGHQVADQMISTGVSFKDLAASGRAAIAAIGGIGTLGLAAAGAAVVAIGASAERSARQFDDLRETLRATRADYAATAAAVDASSRSLSAQGLGSRTDLRTAAASIAAVPTVSTADLSGYVREARDLARVLGQDVPAAAATLAHALQDPAAEAKRLADAHQLGVNPALARTVQLMQQAGDTSGAAALLLGRLGDATRGAAADLTPLQSAWEQLQRSISPASSPIGGAIRAIGDGLNNLAAGAVRAVAAVLGGIGAAVSSLRSAVTDAVSWAASQMPQSVQSAGSFVAGAASGIAQLATGGVPANTQLYLAATRQGLCQDQLALAQKIMQIESSGRQYGQDGSVLRSGAGALGAMQIMPSTGAAYGYSQAQLSDTSGNVSAGVAIIADLWKRYGGNQALVAIAYNGGTGLADAIQSGSKTFAELPPETQQYVKKLAAPQRSATDLAASQQTIDSAYSGAGGTVYAQRQDLTASIAGDTKALQEASRAYAEGRMSQSDYDETTGRLNAHLHDQQAALANLRTPAQETIHHLQEQAAQSGQLEGASRSLFQIQQQMTDQGASQAQIDDALTAKQRDLGNQFAQNVSTIDRQVAAVQKQTAASLDNAAAGDHAANVARAEQQARETAIPGTAEYTRQVQVLTASLDNLSAAQRDAGNIPAIKAHEDAVGVLQEEAAVAGQGADAQQKLLAAYKETQAIIGAGMTLDQPLAKQRLALAAAEVDAAQYRDRMVANANEVSQFWDNLGDTIGNSITAGFANGTISALRFKDVLNAVVSGIVQELLKLAVLNPLKNLFEGTNSSRATLGGVLDSLFGGSSSNSGSLGGATGLGALALGLAGIGNISGSVSGGASSAAAAAGSTIAGIGSAAGGGSFFSALGAGATVLKAADGLNLFNNAAAAQAVANAAAPGARTGDLFDLLGSFDPGKAAAASASRSSSSIVQTVGDAIRDIKSGANDILSAVGGTVTNLNTFVAGAVANAINGVAFSSAAAAGEAVTNLGGTGFAALASQAAQAGFGGATSTAGALSGAASAASSSANVAGYAGGVSATQIADFMPYVSAIVGVAIPLIQGDLGKAGIVAGSAAAGAAVGSFIPGIGTGIGAALGALVGSFFGGPPKNPYDQVDILNNNGHLAIGNTGQQISGKQLAADVAGAQAGIGAVNSMLDMLGLKIANTGDTLNNIDGGRVGIIGTGLDSSIKAVRSIGDLFPYLRFAGANDDSNYTRAATGILANQSYADPTALTNALQQVASFTSGLDALGIHLDSIDNDFKNIQIGTADRTDSSDFSVALAHALPGNTYADQDALQQAIQTVYQFTDGTVPSLLAATTHATSSFQQQIQQLGQTYSDASSQALGYGLNNEVQALQDKFADLSGQLYSQQLQSLRNSNTDVIDRRTAAQYGTASPYTLQSTLTDFDIQAQAQRDALKKSWQDVYGDAAASMQEYIDQSVDLEKTLQAERLQAQEQGNLSLLATQQQAGVTRVGWITADWRAQAKIAGGNDNSSPAAAALNEAADLADFDQSAPLQLTQYKAQLLQLYGTSFEQTGDYAQMIVEAEQSLAEQRLAIVQSYADQAQAAEDSAKSNVSALINQIGQWADGLAQGDNSPLSPQAKLDQARSQYQAVSGAAQAGDYNSAQQFTDYADSYLSAAKAYYGSTADYAQIFSSVTDDALKITSMPPDTLTASAMQAAIKEQTAELVEAMTEVRGELQQIKLSLKQSSSAPARAA